MLNIQVTGKKAIKSNIEEKYGTLRNFAKVKRANYLSLYSILREYDKRNKSIQILAKEFGVSTDEILEELKK